MDGQGPDIRELNDITDRIIGCAIEAHRQLGPGLLESIYERALPFELKAHGVPAESRCSSRSSTRARDWESIGSTSWSAAK